MIRTLTFTEQQLVDMLLQYWFSKPPEAGLAAAKARLAEAVRQEWLDQERAVAKHTDQ